MPFLLEADRALAIVGPFGAVGSWACFWGVRACSCRLLASLCGVSVSFWGLSALCPSDLPFSTCAGGLDGLQDINAAPASTTPAMIVGLRMTFGLLSMIQGAAHHFGNDDTSWNQARLASDSVLRRKDGWPGPRREGYNMVIMPTEAEIG